MNKKNTKVSEQLEDVNISSPFNKILDKKIRLKCRNQKQKSYANLIKDKEIVICVGPAGTGKTYVALAKAIELIQTSTNKYEQLVICKPVVEAGEKIGFLPGNLKEKLAPLLESLTDIIDKLMGKANREKLEEIDGIKIQTIAFFRGKTIDNAILVVDEAQNATPKQIKTIMTRIGENSKFIISGDLDQSDAFNDYKKSGLYDAWNRHANIEEIGFFQFENSDVVRNPLITKILNNYSLDYNKPKPTTKKETVVKTYAKDETLIDKIKTENKKSLLGKSFWDKFKW